MNALTTRNASTLAPATIGEAMKFSELLAGSDMVPRDFKGKPANVLVAIQWGYEVGLGPLQALQNIAVINGRPSIWGDAALALVRAHPACQAVAEGVDGDGDARHGWCEVTRRGEAPQRRTFSVADAKKAGLWGKSGPWQQYPDRMLQLRARGFAVRDVFPDALRGVITAEEAQDMPPEPREVPNTAPLKPVVAARVDDEAAHPLLAPDGRLVTIRAGRWLDAAQKALAKLESVEAVRGWRAAMGEHFAAISEASPDGAQMVHAAEEAAEARLSDLTTDDFPGAVTDRDGNPI